MYFTHRISLVLLGFFLFGASQASCQLLYEETSDSLVLHLRSSRSLTCTKSPFTLSLTGGKHLIIKQSSQRGTDGAARFQTSTGWQWVRSIQDSHFSQEEKTLWMKGLSNQGTPVQMLIDFKEQSAFTTEYFHKDAESTPVTKPSQEYFTVTYTFPKLGNVLAVGDA